MSNSGATLDAPTRVRWLVLALACAGSALLYVHRYAWGVIKPLVKNELQLTDTQLGWLDSAFNAAYTIFQVPAGMAGDRFGPAAVLPLIILGWSAAVGATALGHGFWSLLALRLGFGATQSGAFPCLSKLTRSWFPPAMRTTAQGIVGVTAGRFGAALAPILVGSLLLGRMQLGWRAAVVVMALAGSVLAIVMRLLLRNSPAEHPAANAAERVLVGMDEPPAAAAAPLAYSLKGPVLVSLGMLTLCGFTSTFNDALFVNWIPLFLSEGKGLSQTQTGWLASLPLFSGAAGGFVGGMLNDWLLRRTGKLRMARVVVAMSGKLLSAALVALSLQVESGRDVMLIIAVAKFFTDWSVPTLWGAVTDIGGRAAGRVFGLVNALASLGGVLAGPVLGYTKQEHGWNTVFWLIVAVYIVSGLCWLGVNPRKKLILDL